MPVIPHNQCHDQNLQDQKDRDYESHVWNIFLNLREYHLRGGSNNPHIKATEYYVRSFFKTGKYPELLLEASSLLVNFFTISESKFQEINRRIRIVQPPGY